MQVLVRHLYILIKKDTLARFYAMGVTERRGVLLGLRHVENVNCENTDRAERNDGWSHGSHTRSVQRNILACPKTVTPRTGQAPQVPPLQRVGTSGGRKKQRDTERLS